MPFALSNRSLELEKFLTLNFSKTRPGSPCDSPCSVWFVTNEALMGVVLKLYDGRASLIELSILGAVSIFGLMLGAFG